jgi:Na+-translocating ferredoxin:NAD+ oxidoreductase RnfG subunit
MKKRNQDGGFLTLGTVGTIAGTTIISTLVATTTKEVVTPTAKRARHIVNKLVYKDPENHELMKQAAIEATVEALEKIGHNLADNWDRVKANQETDKKL